MEAKHQKLVDRKIDFRLKKKKERKKLRKEQRDADEDVSSEEEEENVREAFGAPQCEQEGCKLWCLATAHGTQLLRSAHRKEKINREEEEAEAAEEDRRRIEEETVARRRDELNARINRRNERRQTCEAVEIEEEEEEEDARLEENAPRCEKAGCTRWHSVRVHGMQLLYTNHQKERIKLDKKVEKEAGEEEEDEDDE